MPDEDRTSNWLDAAHVALPSCPFCLSKNLTQMAPVIEELRPGRYLCAICSKEFAVTIRAAPPR